MLKLIFKNIIANRRRYLWILLELCIATTISWFLLDKVLVTEYVNLVSVGYDRDRLVRFNFHEIPAKALPAGQEERDIDQKMADVKRILDIIRSDSRVESATFTAHQIFDGWSIYANSVMNNEWAADSTNSYLGYVQVYFWRDTDFFKTFGLKDASGSELKEFEEQPMSKSQIIISKTLANYLFPGENPVGRSIYEKSDKFDPESDKGLIAGVVNDAIYRSNYDRFPIAFNPKNNKDVEREGGINYLHGVIRLKDGVDVEKFARDYSPKLSELRFGEIYCSSLEPYAHQTELMTRNKKNENFVSESIALFFFFNILLCMTGTFYLQTRRRSEEAGVMRSFGATRGFIVREMMGEGFILVTIAWIIGCGLFYLLSLDDGLATNNFMEHESPILKELVPRWYDDFATHFAIVSVIIYAILLIAVMLGIYFPARKIAKISPVDALRDE